MTVVQILAGNIARSTFLPVPDDASVVDAADVSCWVKTPDGTKIPIVTITEVDDNSFRADWTIPDAAPEGHYFFRWESNPPSPKISFEGPETHFRVRASTFPTP